MPSYDGFVFEDRAVMDHAVFQDDWLYRLFRWCVMRANYAPGVFKGHDIPIGSFATGTNSGAESLGVARSKFHRGLHRLTEIPYEVITLEVKRDFTIVTVVNYTTYQTSKRKSETPMKRQRNANETPVKTIEEGNKGIREKEERCTASRFTPPAVEEVNAYCLERQNGVSGQKFVDHYEAVGWKVGQKRMVSWKAAVRTWEQNEFNKKPTTPKLCQLPTEEERKAWRPS